jgi:type I restriction enzyme S subunit
MKGWKEVRIGDLFEIKAGGDLQEANYSPCRTDHARWAIYANSLENKGLYGYTSQPRYRGNAVTITGRGDIGHAEFRDDDFDAIVRLLVLLPKVDVDCRYITYYINSLVHFPIESTGVPQLTAPKVKRIKINLPQKAEQTAIANILSKVDEAIASVQNSIAAAERLKKSLMQNLLTGKMKPDGTFRTPEEFYIDENFGKVPIGWEVKSIDEISDFVQYGLNISSSDNGQIPMLRMNNIVNGEMSDSPLVYVNLNDQLLQQYELEAGDILFNRTNSMDLVGKVGVFRLMGKYVFSSYLIRVRVSKENNPYYINLALNSYPIQCSLRSKATPAVSQANINSKSLRHTQIFKPKKKDEQDLVMSKIEEVEHVILQKNDKVKKLEQLKKSLMQNLLTGKIKIDKDI